MKQIKILVTGGLFLTAFSAHATWYTNLSDFKKALNPKYSDVNLSNLTLTGAQKYSYTPAAQNGYDWTATAGDNNGLSALPNALSTFSSNQLKLTFSLNKTVTAFGGFVANTDGDGVITGSQVTMSFVGGSSPSSAVVPTGSTGFLFLGWVGTGALASVTIDPIGGYTAAGNPALSEAFTGTIAPAPKPVPEPASMLAIGGGILAMVRRKRK